MRPDVSKWRERRAFTLIEMMVVLILMSILAAAIIPEMKGSFQDALLRSTGRDFINVFNLASSRAVSLDRACRVQLNPQEHRYILQRQVQSGMQQRFEDLRDVVGGEGKWDSRITVEIRRPGDDALNEQNAPKVQATENDTSDAISFFPDGTADAAEIHLRDREGFELVLQLNPVTSRVHITEPRRE